MRSYYWWNDFKVRKVSHSNLRRRVSVHPDLYRVAPSRDIYSQDNPWPAAPAWPAEGAEEGDGEVVSQPKPTLRRFARLFAKQLLVCLFWAAVCVVITVVYGGDFLYLGFPCMLYYGVLGIGLVVSVGLPFKWFRDYRLSGGFVVDGEQKDWS